MDIYQLIYLSTATDDFLKDEDQEMVSILNIANIENKKSDITGLLLYKGGVFLQLIEGPKKYVEDLYKKISKDSRHNSLQVLVKQTTEQRCFPDWGMAFEKVEGLNLELVNSVIPWKDMVDGTRSGKQYPEKDIVDIFWKFKHQIHNKKEDVA